MRTTVSKEIRCLGGIQTPSRPKHSEPAIRNLSSPHASTNTPWRTSNVTSFRSALPSVRTARTTSSALVSMDGFRDLARRWLDSGRERDCAAPRRAPSGVTKQPGQDLVLARGVARIHPRGGRRGCHALAPRLGWPARRFGLPPGSLLDGPDPSHPCRGRRSRPASPAPHHRPICDAGRNERSAGAAAGPERCDVRTRCAARTTVVTFHCTRRCRSKCRRQSSGTLWSSTATRSGTGTPRGQCPAGFGRGTSLDS